MFIIYKDVHSFLSLQIQYVFIHNALDELLTCGETEITAANMRIAIGKLGRSVQSGTGTGFQKQYEVHVLYVAIIIFHHTSSSHLVVHIMAGTIVTAVDMVAETPHVFPEIFTSFIIQDMCSYS